MAGVPIGGVEYEETSGSWAVQAESDDPIGEHKSGRRAPGTDAPRLPLPRPRPVFRGQTSLELATTSSPPRCTPVQTKTAVPHGGHKAKQKVYSDPEAGPQLRRVRHRLANATAVAPTSKALS